MSSENNVNSNSYWDHRFDTDWESMGGQQQSRFFAHVAIDAMPDWLVHIVRWNGLSVCDWGCAEGDGTEAIASALSWDITGIDFSAPAIDRARAKYRNVKYSHENLLDEPERPAFDVLFSSNTLEHFPDPWQVFDKVAKYASKYVVLLLPYREFVRHPEHEFTFDSVNIPVAPNGDWSLVHCAVADTRFTEPTYWQGSQVLLVYVRTAQLAAQRMMLSDMFVSAGERLVEPTKLIAEMAQARRDLVQERSQLTNDLEHERSLLKDAVAQERSQLESVLAQEKERLTEELEKLRVNADKLSEENKTLAAQSSQSFERIHFLQYREQALTTEISTLLATKSWRYTAPLRLVRAAPGWMRRRVNDVKFAYSRGGIRSVVYRSITYAPRHVKRQVVASTAHVLPVTKAIRAPRERRALPDVFVFSILDWHFRIQRPQHLAREFARAGHRVYFFSNHFEDAPEPGFSVERLDESLPLYQVKLKVRGAPQIYFAAPTTEAIKQIGAGMQLFRDWSGTDRSWSLVQHAWWYPVATRMQSQCLTYDCMDHHEGFGNVPKELLDLEERIMRRADLLVATSTWLEDLARKYNLRVEVIRNAGQYSDFCNAPVERYVDPRGRKIIGYYGAIAEWFDAELVVRVAQAFPDALVLLVGADTANVGARLRDLDNVEMTGEVPYTRLPYYLYAFDICMLPFKVIPLTLATNPVKVYEYLAAGRSVVSIELPEMVQFDGLVRLADSHEGFIGRVREAMDALPDDNGLVEKRKAFAEGQTWAHRVATLHRGIEALPRPRVSAIVLTYNNLALTKHCLDSLEKSTDDVDLEIIVVDNASSDGSPEFLSSWAASRPNVKLILNPDNRGFARGNNQGLEIATGDYLVILNNDTVVTRGWAWRMINHLRNTPEIGIIGPVTNNIGNEARIETRYTSLDDMHVEAESHTEDNVGKWFKLETVAFFCAMMPRSTLELCGLISEDYGLGFFEDDDYCRKVQAAGLIVACAEDAFVHHHLSASFDKLGAEKKRALFEKNRAIYEAKWGQWVQHRYRSGADVVKS